jgi:hypothetical protein
MTVGPATFTTMLIVGVLLIAGVLILRSGRARAGGGKPVPVCQQCGHKNVPGATYCARCGADMRDKVV